MVLGLIFDIGVHQIRIFRTYTKPAVSRLPLKHNSTLPAYFQHAIGRTLQNPRLKPGAIKFDAFSILVSDVRIPRPLSSDAVSREVGHPSVASITPFVRHRLEGDGTNTPSEGHGMDPIADITFQLAEREPRVNRRRPRSGGFQPPSSPPLQEGHSSVTAWKAVARTRPCKGMVRTHCRNNVSARGTRARSKPPEAKERRFPTAEQPAASRTPFVRHRLEGDGTNTPSEGHGTDLFRSKHATM